MLTGGAGIRGSWVVLAYSGSGADAGPACGCGALRLVADVCCRAPVPWPLGQRRATESTLPRTNEIQAR
jgi:hypothetical protein